MQRRAQSALRPATLWLAVLAIGIPALSAQPEPPRELESASLGGILNAIQQLESTNDAKCQATATRLENFMYGTPLSEEARFEKVRLQKELISELWAAASASARQAGRGVVTPADLTPVLNEALPLARGPEGEVTLETTDGSVVVLDATDLRQYTSVAYSLRAILAVQQDALFFGAAELLSLDSESLDALSEHVDLRTLAALQLADREARRLGGRVLMPELLVAAWKTMSPGREKSAAVPAGVSATGGAAWSATGAPLLNAIIDEKIEAYSSYNQIDRAETQRLFLRNTERFYARYRLPATQEQIARIEGAFRAVVVGFAREALTRCAEVARVPGEPIRQSVVHRVVQELAPHEVDDLEDVTFFPRLPRERRFKLESYDMDSFRDLGLHWRFLNRALEREAQSLALDLDPFAAERLAEAIAQYGVLVFRIAGSIAREEARYPFLVPDNVTRAGRAVPVLAERDRRTSPLESSGSSRLRSAASIPGGDTSAPLFTDVTSEVGLGFRHSSSDWLNRLRRRLSVTPPTFSGGGIAAEDVDGDGDVDLLLVGGMGNQLLINDGSGGFLDATRTAGIGYRRADGYPGEARQPIIADFDNDGRQDLLITYANDPHRLYRQATTGRFEDLTDVAGLGGPGLVGGPATVADFDGDGLLDIYVGYFGNYLAGDVPASSGSVDTLGTPSHSTYEGDLPTLSRDNKNALPNRLFRNEGGLRFTDVTEQSGTGDAGWAQAVSHSDFDLDGRQDLFVANDFGRNALLLNRGGGRFEDATVRLGMDHAYHSMNAGIGDLNGDGFPDLYVSNINTLIKDTKYVLPDEETTMESGLEALATMRIQERSLLYASSLSRGRLSGYAISSALDRGDSQVGWAWDADFFDSDNDGDDDLYVTNGANEYRILDELWMVRDEQQEPVFLRLSHHYQPNVLFLNEGGRLRGASPASGADVAGNARSAVYLDFDEDGDLDIAINNFHSMAVFLRNESQRLDNHWLKLRLEGDPQRGSNRDAIGSRVIATTAGGKRIWREVRGGGGYLSMEPRLQHFGLGAERQADLEITWPNGEVQRAPGLAAGITWLIRQGEAPVGLGSPAPARGP